MELKKDTSENVKFAYEDENMPNPNDSLFGNRGSNLGGGNIITSYNEDEPAIIKKSGPPSWIWIAAAVVIIAIIGIVAVKLLGGHKLNGAYIVKRAEVDGVEYTIEQFEKATGMEFYIRLEIDGKEGYLIMSFAGMVEEGNIHVDVDGDDIHVSRGSTELVFKYDKKTKTICYEKDGSKLIFEKIADIN